MKRLSLLIKPASSLCNMRCRYCFYADVGAHRELPSYGIMKGETARRVIDNTFADLAGGDEITFAFQGGEPTLAGLDWFEDFTAYAARAAERTGHVSIRYAFQTNGLLLDSRWAGLFRRHHFLVGLSLDGGKGFHDRNRRDAEGRGTWEAVMEAKRLLDANQVDYNILCVLTNGLAGEPDKVWGFILREGIGYIQFIPCLEGLDGAGESPRERGGGWTGEQGLRPPRFAQFYNRLFSLWRGELERGHYVSVKLFDDTANYFFKGIPSACGIDGRCGVQFVVEADGGVYPCDFYVLDTCRTGSLTSQTLAEIFASPRTRAFLAEGREPGEARAGETQTGEARAGEAPPRPAPGQAPPRTGGTACAVCAYHALCRGGCKRMRKAMCHDGTGTFCGYRAFLDKNLNRLGEVLGKYWAG